MYTSAGISSPEEERSLAPPRTPKPLPRLKVEANISGVRVAIVEDVDNPQALTLKVYSNEVTCNTHLLRFTL